MSKHLVKHLWRQHEELITEKSFLHCHAKGVHSIMLIEKPEHTIRLFVAEPGNDLCLNYSFDSEMSVAFHPHHCDVTLHVIKGCLQNKIVEESDNGIALNKFIYHSKIKENETKFERVGAVVLSVVGVNDLLPNQSIFMPADTIHTVAAPRNGLTAWFVYEGKENPNYIPYCASNVDLTKHDFSGLYQKPTRDQVGQLLQKCDLL